jgi:hypothetical protein
MYDILLFLAILLCISYIVYKNYDSVVHFINKYLLYSENIKEIKDKMKSLDIS